MLANIFCLLENLVMQFEAYPRTQKDGSNFRVTFEPPEIDCVVSAHAEFIYNCHLLGNPSSISTFHERVANSRGAEKITNNFVSLEDLKNVLIKFHEGTSDAILQMPEDTAVPPFASKYIPERQALGRQALSLAEQLDQKQIEADDPSFQAKNMIEGIENLLRQSSDDL